jgi:hypothetical protein
MVKLYENKTLTLDECQSRFERWHDKKACALAVFLNIRDKFVFRNPKAKAIYSYAEDQYLVITASEYNKIIGDCNDSYNVILHNTAYIVIKLDSKGSFYKGNNHENISN